MTKKKHTIDTLFVLLLYMIFALLSMFTVTIGIWVYSHIVDQSESRTNVRASLSYVANKLRASESGDSVFIERISGVDVLIFSESAEENPSVTRIYYYNGSLREHLVPSKDTEFHLGEGQKLVAIDQFTVSEIDGLFTLTSTDATGKTQVMYIKRRV